MPPFCFDFSPRRYRLAIAVSCGILAAGLGLFPAAPARAQAAPDSAAASADTIATSPSPPPPPAPVEGSGGQANPAAETPNAPPGGDSTFAKQLIEAGLENITVSEDGRRVAFENRRYRHSATALGVIAAAAKRPLLVFERRLGLAAAAIEIPADGTPPSTVVHASDGGFPAPPAGPRLAPTNRSLDFIVGPLLTYELPRILDPALVRWELQPELRWNPWPGGRLRAGVVIPIEDQLGASDENPDVDNVRPGPMLLEQYGWSPGAALFSGTAGLLSNNRYGLSMGVARPLVSGDILIDGQADVTGFIAFRDEGTTFSTPDRWSGFVGVTYRPRLLDLGVRFRAARFLRGDEGLEVEVKRAMGDFDVAFYVQKIRGLKVIEENGSVTEPLVTGFRLVLPVPPLTRPVTRPVRVLPIDRFTFTYHEESTPTGQYLANVASREDYIRQLDRSSLVSNAYRYREARLGVKEARPRPTQWVSMVGTTGFINTPWAGVMADREIEFGYNHYPKEASYFGRKGSDPLQPDKEFPNEVYYAAMGFLPRVEVSMRWTVVPGFHPFQDIVPESQTIYSDRMFSGRVEVLQARAGRPGLAVGVDDARGTRRFHSTYGVLGLPFDIYHLQNRVTVGYAPRAFKASRRSLDGVFGAFEVTVRRSVAVAVEHDTEKWNSMLGINLGFGLRARVALLDLEHLGIGVGWFTAL